jgi:hypothetical protein
MAAAPIAQRRPHVIPESAWQSFLGFYRPQRSDKAARAIRMSIRLCLRRAGTLEDYNVARLSSAIGHPLLCSYCTWGQSSLPRCLCCGLGKLSWVVTLDGVRHESHRFCSGFRLLGLFFGEGDEKRGGRLNSSVSSAAKVGRQSDHYSYPRAVPSLPAFGGGKKPKQRSGLSPLQPCRDWLW